MTNKEIVLTAMFEFGRQSAQNLQAAAADMTGTELYAAEGSIPDFQAAKTAKNMLQRKAGEKDGFVCRSSAGRVVRLIQVYDSDTYPEEPENLPAQWRFVWSTDPKKALPFIELTTSPYATGDCCTYDGHVWRGGQDTNTWAPGSAGVKWDDLGTIEEVMG